MSQTKQQRKKQAKEKANRKAFIHKRNTGTAKMPWIRNNEVRYCDGSEFDIPNENIVRVQ